jgi:hypothetical protein
MGFSNVYYGAGTLGLQVFSTLPEEGGTPPRRVKAPVRRKRAHLWDVAHSLLMNRIQSGRLASYSKFDRSKGDFRLLIRGKPASRSRPCGRRYGKRRSVNPPSLLRTLRILVGVLPLSSGPAFRARHRAQGFKYHRRVGGPVGR